MLARSVATLVAFSAGVSAADTPSPNPPAKPPDAAVEPPPESGREVGLFPLIGGDTDNGFGLGAIGSIAVFDKDNPVYLWKLDFSGFYATKHFPPSPSYIDASAKLTLPQLLDDRLRLELRPSFTLDEALPFYGLGNKPPVPTTTVRDRDFYQRLHPSMFGLARWRLSKHWYLLGALRATYNKITTAAASTLQTEIGPTDPYLTKGHGVLNASAGISYDSRDNELAPTKGQYHQIKALASPRIGDAVPYSYQQYNAIARFYVTLIPRRIVLALRGVVDLQTGNVPVYEESRYEDTSAIGGGQGVRGVPAYSFYGRLKTFGNVEVRYKPWRFSALSRRFVVGFAGFVDAGRLWTDAMHKHPELDGTGLGLHWGAGGGIRIQQGRSFLVRADVAYSPDAKPIGVYVEADEAF